MKPGCTREKMRAPVPIVYPRKHRRYRQCYERIARDTWHGDLSVCANHQRTAPHFSQPAGLLKRPADIIGGYWDGAGIQIAFVTEVGKMISIRPCLGLLFPAFAASADRKYLAISQAALRADSSTGSAPPNRDAGQIANGE